MPFYADLHIHSKYSRATSKNLDLENLSYWAQKKGITVVGTGDFTHPAWFAELQEKLVPAEPGLFQLRQDLQKAVQKRLPAICHRPVRFMLSVEISTIYKKGDKTRKIHHLIYAPDFEKAKRINDKLGSIGNIRSDGRPILGLDSRHLLEIVLEAGEGCYLVPAHIWTPWFAVLGSKSGFDSVAECYADLSEHIFAVETGLSSDPAMNWRVSHLDRYRLVSNSDAHSPGKLGREANQFHTDLDYYAIRRALETGEGYGGTVEFFPEEGKYHLDGHRKCQVRLTPEESRRYDGRCPTCNRPLTLGVLYRVEQLSDRPESYRPDDACEFNSFVPLPEILSETLGVGPNSKRVSQHYENTLGKLGDELSILSEVPVEAIAKASSSVLAEGIARMRQGKVICDAGYDGEYGVIKLFEAGELSSKTGSGVLFDLRGLDLNSGRPQEKTPKTSSPKLLEFPETSPVQKKSESIPSELVDSQLPTVLQGLDPDQQKVAQIVSGALLIVAGPGSGKTRTLTHRVAYLVQEAGVDPESCLTLTFTRRATDEMRERLQKLLPQQWKRLPIFTFHGFAYAILQEFREAAGLQRGFRLADEDERTDLLVKSLDLSPTQASKRLKQISKLKRSSDAKKPEEQKLLTAYQTLLEEQALVDYEDLMLLTVDLLKQHPEIGALLQERYIHLSIDEYQDIDALQYEIIRLLRPSGSNLCAIGDPDQSIYGFRGAEVKFFLSFEKDFAPAQVFHLKKNYRSSATIGQAASQVIQPTTLRQEVEFQWVQDQGAKIVIHQSPTERAEAEFAVHTIETLIGGSSFFSFDSDRVADHQEANVSFSDFAILYRTQSQVASIEEALFRSGIPFQTKSDDPLSDADTWDPRADRVSFLTLHASKGLEFPIVFLLGCEDGMMPLYWGSSPNAEELAEERRLFYVGMTRAERLLFLCHANKRRVRGKLCERNISPFLQEIQEILVERKKASYSRKTAGSQNTQIELF